MNCRDCVERLLVADPTVIVLALEGPATDTVEGLDAVDLIDHLRTCDACRKSARHILEDQADLAAYLGARGPNRPLPEALSTARRSASQRRRRRRRSAWAVAAAAMAGLLGIRALEPGRDAEVSRGPVSARRMSEPLGTEVEALLDESVVVLETEDENVVVFWFYQGRRQ